MFKKILKHLIIFSCALKLIGVVFLCNLPKAYAKFDQKRLYITNIAIPTGMAAIRAHFEGTSIKKAIIQSIFGGYIMQESMKRAAKIEEKNALYAWETKLMFNLGASLCESAGYEDFTFKMDVGPVWIINKGNDIKLKLGINGVVAPILHLSQGSKFDYKKSLKYGTMVFEKKQKKNGNLYGSNALAYSTANTFVTNHNGNHSGHELIHTYQYRRNCLYPIQIGDYWPEFTTKYFKEDRWVDDTGWFLNWSLQCGWASWRNKDKDYDIPLEQEAYYMERYRKKWEP